MGSCMSGQVDFDGEVNLYHFDLHKAVGRGAFGKVRVVEHKRTKKLYALKYIDKARCIRQKAVANIIQERRLLEEIDHPFVVNMRYAFQDDENCFFVLDLMLGGDLRFHLERKGPFPEEVVRFWVAELSQALEYLHRQRIMHRDIKPDNILLDAAGHAHFTDFNIAIHYSEKRMHTSVAGSMAYMAPEVVDSTGALAGGRKGYTWCVDWWSLGVTAYELLFQRRPFDGRTAEKMKSSILRDPIRFPILDGGMVGVSRRDAPPNVVSQEGASALRQFLERDPKKRLGCRPHGQGISDIEQHPWFRSIDWDQVNNKALTPPFTPDQKKPNFDVTHELDEFLMVEKPLTHTKRKANPDLEKMKPELRQMEEQSVALPPTCHWVVVLIPSIGSPFMTSPRRSGCHTTRTMSPSPRRSLDLPDHPLQDTLPLAIPVTILRIRRQRGT
ncbi:kinase-like protein [Punctularia strigosozonata HHB-11173 SS5]|uniref:kinase-like protein n=1 Tax=Punctularia strigosozonata (strain HHB-11173) TaxID=741275 RepID=UPI000441674D|nr:kinase-like protein [Punctularia strigosozonata HHB-11173 SS5]EIN10012.1 kinase-like protein [Punctularia strigosozonata HHB-11173 SS5]